MALRNVTVTYTHAEIVGDESIEVWVKRGSAAWALDDTVAAGAGPTQDFIIAAEEADGIHQVQVRAIREGRYRPGYVLNNPDGWPAQSLHSFLPGASPAAAPTLDALAWSRTSASSQRVTATVTPHASHMALALQLLRNGVVVAEVAGPHTGAISMVDLDPPIAAEHSYTARHVEASILYGAQTGAQTRWTGPNAPTSLAQSGADQFYGYTVAWGTPPSGAVTRVRDDYLCSAVLAVRGVTAADANDFTTLSLEKNSAMGSNGNVTETFTVEARHEVTTFGVADVSDWRNASVDAETAPDETAFNSCPA